MLMSDSNNAILALLRRLTLASIAQLKVDPIDLFMHLYSRATVAAPFSVGANYTKVQLLVYVSLSGVRQ